MHAAAPPFNVALSTQERRFFSACGAAFAAIQKRTKSQVKGALFLTSQRKMGGLGPRWPFLFGSSPGICLRRFLARRRTLFFVSPPDRPSAAGGVGYHGFPQAHQPSKWALKRTNSSKVSNSESHSRLTSLLLPSHSYSLTFFCCCTTYTSSSYLTETYN